MNTWCWMPTRKQCPVCIRLLLWCLELTGKLKFRITCGRQYQKAYFTGNIFRVLTGAMTPENFQKRLGKMRITENNSQK